jgi:hypothetical protein
VSPAVNPVPVQLHGVAAQTTDVRALGAANVAVTVKPVADLAVKLVPSVVPSGPNCDQSKESFAPCAAELPTATRESDHAAVASKIKTAKFRSQKRYWEKGFHLDALLGGDS